MPSLTPVSEGTETLTSVSEETFQGFLPGTVLYRAPYPFPSSTSYPGPKLGQNLQALSESTETLSPLVEV